MAYDFNKLLFKEDDDEEEKKYRSLDEYLEDLAEESRDYAKENINDTIHSYQSAREEENERIADATRQRTARAMVQGRGGFLPLREDEDYAALGSMYDGSMRSTINDRIKTLEEEEAELDAGMKRYLNWQNDANLGIASEYLDFDYDGAQKRMHEIQSELSKQRAELEKVPENAQEKFGSRQNYYEGIYNDDYVASRTKEITGEISSIDRELASIENQLADYDKKLQSYNLGVNTDPNFRLGSDAELTTRKLELEAQQKKLTDEQRELRDNSETAYAIRYGYMGDNGLPDVNKLRESINSRGESMDAKAAYYSDQLAYYDYVAKHGASDDTAKQLLDNMIASEKAYQIAVDKYVADYDIVESAKRNKWTREQVEAEAQRWRDLSNQADEYIREGNGGIGVGTAYQYSNNADSLDKYARTLVPFDEIKAEYNEADQSVSKLEADLTEAERQRDTMGYLTTAEAKNENARTIASLEAQLSAEKAKRQSLQLDVAGATSRALEEYITAPTNRSVTLSYPGIDIKEQKNVIEAYKQYINSLLYENKAVVDKQGNVTFNGSAAKSIYGGILKDAMVKAGFDEYDAADAVEYVRRAYNEINAQKDNKLVKELTEGNPLWMSVASVATNLASGIGFMEGVRMLLSDSRYETIDVNSDFIAPHRVTQTIRETVQGMADVEVELFGKQVDLFDEAYGILMSSADSIASAYLGGAIMGATGLATAAENIGSKALLGSAKLGEIAGEYIGGLAGGLVLGSAAGVEKMVDLSEKGADLVTALTGGIVAATFESLFETVSISQFNFMSEIKNVSNLKDIANNMIKSFIGNGSEELATELANVLYDTYVNYDFSDYKQRYDMYLQNYLTYNADPALEDSENNRLADEYAKKMATKDMTDQVFKAGLTGAIQGVFMGVGGVIRSKVSDASHIAQVNKTVKTDISKMNGAELYQHLRESEAAYSQIATYNRDILTRDGANLTKAQIKAAQDAKAHLQEVAAAYQNADTSMKLLSDDGNGYYTISRGEGFPVLRYHGEMENGIPNGIGTSWSIGTNGKTNIWYGEFKNGSLSDGVVFLGDGSYRTYTKNEKSGKKEWSTVKPLRLQAEQTVDGKVTVAPVQITINGETVSAPSAYQKALATVHNASRTQARQTQNKPRQTAKEKTRKQAPLQRAAASEQKPEQTEQKAAIETDDLPRDKRGNFDPVKLLDLVIEGAFDYERAREAIRQQLGSEQVKMFDFNYNLRAGENTAQPVAAPTSQNAPKANVEPTAAQASSLPVDLPPVDMTLRNQIRDEILSGSDLSVDDMAQKFNTTRERIVQQLQHVQRYFQIGIRNLESQGRAEDQDRIRNERTALAYAEQLISAEQASGKENNNGGQQTTESQEGGTKPAVSERPAILGSQPGGTDGADQDVQRGRDGADIVGSGDNAGGNQEILELSASDDSGNDRGRTESGVSADEIKSAAKRKYQLLDADFVNATSPQLEQKKSDGLQCVIISDQAAKERGITSETFYDDATQSWFSIFRKSDVDNSHVIDHENIHFKARLSNSFASWLKSEIDSLFNYNAKLAKGLKVNGKPVSIVRDYLSAIAESYGIRTEGTAFENLPLEDKLKIAEEYINIAYCNEKYNKSETGKRSFNDWESVRAHVEALQSANQNVNIQDEGAFSDTPEAAAVEAQEAPAEKAPSFAMRRDSLEAQRNQLNDELDEIKRSPSMDVISQRQNSLRIAQIRQQLEMINDEINNLNEQAKKEKATPPEEIASILTNAAAPQSEASNDPVTTLQSEVDDIYNQMTRGDKDLTVEQMRELAQQHAQKQAQLTKLKKKQKSRHRAQTFTFLTENRRRGFQEIRALVREALSRNGHVNLSLLRAKGYTLDGNNNIIYDPASLQFTEGGVEAFSTKLADMINLKSRLVKDGLQYTWLDLKRSMQRHGLNFAPESITGRSKNPGLSLYARASLPMFYYSAEGNRDAISDPFNDALAMNYAEMEKNEAAHVLYDYFAIDENGQSIFSRRRQELYDTAKICAYQDAVAMLYDAVEKNEKLTVYDPNDKYIGTDVGNGVKRIRLKENGQYINTLISLEDLILGVYYDYLHGQADAIVASERNLTPEEAAENEGKIESDVSEALGALSDREGITVIGEDLEESETDQNEEKLSQSENAVDEDGNDYDHGELSTRLGSKETRNYDDPVFRAVVARLLGTTEQEVSKLFADKDSLEYEDLYGEEAGFGITGGRARGGLDSRYDSSDDPNYNRRRMRFVSADELQEWFKSDPSSVSDFGKLFYGDEQKTAMWDGKTKIKGFDGDVSFQTIYYDANKKRNLGGKAKECFIIDGKPHVADSADSALIPAGCTVVTETAHPFQKSASLRAGVRNFNINAKAMIIAELIRQTKELNLGTVDIEINVEKYPGLIPYTIEHIAEKVKEAYDKYNIDEKVADKDRTLNFNDDFLDQDFVPDQVFKAAKSLETAIDVDRSIESDYAFRVAESGDGPSAEVFEAMGAKNGRTAQQAYLQYQEAMNAFDIAYAAFIEKYGGTDTTIWMDTPEGAAVRDAWTKEINAARKLKEETGRTRMYNFTDQERAALEGDITITVEENGVPKEITLAKALEEQEKTILRLEVVEESTQSNIEELLDEIDKLNEQKQNDIDTLNSYDKDDDYSRGYYRSLIRELDNQINRAQEALNEKKFDLERTQYGIEQSKKRFEVLRRGIDTYVEPQLKALNDTGSAKSILSAQDAKTQDMFRTIMDRNGVIYIYTPKNISAASGDTRAKGKNSIGITSYEFAHDLFASDPYYLYMGNSAFLESKCYGVAESIVRLINADTEQQEAAPDTGFDPEGRPYPRIPQSEDTRMETRKVEGKDSYGNVIADKTYSSRRTIASNIAKENFKYSVIDLLRAFDSDPKALHDNLSKLNDPKIMELFENLASTVLSGEDLHDLLWWHDRYNSTYTIAALAWLDRNKNTLDEGLADRTNKTLSQQLREENLTDSELANALFGYMQPTSQVTIEELNKLRQYVRENYEMMFKMNDEIWEDIGYGQKKTGITNILDPEANQNLYKNIAGLDQFEIVLGRPANSMFAEGFELRVYDGADGEAVRQIILDRDADWNDRNAALMLGLNLLEVFQTKDGTFTETVRNSKGEEVKKSTIPIDPIRSYANARFYESATNLKDLDSPLSRLTVMLENGIKSGIPKPYEQVIREAIATGNAYEGLKNYMHDLVVHSKKEFVAFRDFLYSGHKNGKPIFTNARGDKVNSIMYYLDQLSGASDIKANYNEIARIYAQHGFNVPSNPDSAKQLMIEKMADFLISDSVVNKVNPYGATLTEVLEAIKGQTDTNLLPQEVFAQLMSGLAIKNLDVWTVDYGTQYAEDQAAYKRKNTLKYGQVKYNYETATDFKNHDSPIYRFWNILNTKELQEYDGEYRDLLDRAINENGAGTFELLRDRIKMDEELRDLIFNTQKGISEARVQFNVLDRLYENRDVLLSPSDMYAAIREAGMKEKGLDLPQKPDEDSIGAQYKEKLRDFLVNGGERPNPRSQVRVDGDAVRQFVNAILLTIDFRDKDMRQIRFYLRENNYDAIARMFQRIFTADNTVTDAAEQYELYKNLYYESGKKSRYEVAGRRLASTAQYISNITHSEYTTDNLLEDIAKYGNSKCSARLGSDVVSETIRGAMDVDPKYRMSQKNLDKLKAELNELETIRMKEVAEQIKEARAQGDLSENSEYKAAKEEQEKLYARIADLKDRISNAFIEDNAAQDGIAGRGSTVKLMDSESGKMLELSIVDSEEANPRKGKVSVVSPIGNALIGHQVGDEITVTTREGKASYRIESVERSIETGEEPKAKKPDTFKDTGKMQKNVKAYEHGIAVGNASPDYMIDNSVVKKNYDHYLQTLTQYLEDASRAFLKENAKDFSDMVEANAVQRGIQLKYIQGTFRNLLKSYLESEGVSERLYDYMYGLYEDNLLKGRDGILDIFRSPTWAVNESSDGFGFQVARGTDTILNREIYSTAKRLGYADELTDAVAKYDMYNVTSEFYSGIMQLASSYGKNVYGTSEWFSCAAQVAHDTLADYVEDVDAFITSVQSNPMLLFGQSDIVKRLYYAYVFTADSISSKSGVKSGETDAYATVSKAITEIVRNNPKAEWSMIAQASGKDILRMLCADDNAIGVLTDEESELFYKFQGALFESEYGKTITEAMARFLETEIVKVKSSDERELLSIYFGQKGKTARDEAQAYTFMNETVDTSLSQATDYLVDEQDAAMNAKVAGYFDLLEFGDSDEQERAAQLLERELAREATFRSVADSLLSSRGLVDSENLPESIMKNSMFFVDDPNFRAYMCGAISAKFGELAEELRMQTGDGQDALDFSRFNRIKGSIASHDQIMLAVNLYNLAVQYAEASREVENQYSKWRTGYLNVTEEIRDWITTHTYDNFLSAQLSILFTHSNPDYEAQRLAAKLNGYVLNNITGAKEILAQQGYGEAYEYLGLTEADFVNYRNALIDGSKEEIKEAFDAIKRTAGKAIKDEYTLSKKLANGATAWRYAAMLSNLTTHTNNLVSTALNVANHSLADVPTYFMERFAINHGMMDPSEATVAFASRINDKDLFDLAADDYLSAKQYLYDRGKLGSRISEIIKESGSAIATRNPGMFLLDLEDRGIGFGVYTQQFANILKARDMDASDYAQLSDVEKAKIQAIAVDQTQTILFRNISTLSKLLGNVNNTKIGKVVFAPLLPFVNIAGNLATTAYETSIFGWLGVGWDAFAQHLAKNIVTDADGNVIASNSLSRALYKTALATQNRIDSNPANAKTQLYRKISMASVGTLGMALGVFGRMMGLISAGGTGDDDLDNLREASGYQKYSLKIGDRYIDLTRAFPASFSLLLGAKIADMFKTGNVHFGDAFVDTFANNTFVGNLLDGIARIQDSIGALNNEDELDKFNKVLRGIWASELTMLQNYATQFFPGIIKTLENTLWEKNKDTFFYNKESKVPYSAQYIISDFFEMIPGIDVHRVDKRDMYGKPTKHETFGEYLIRALIGTNSKQERNDYDEWLNDLAGRTYYDEKGNLTTYADRVIFDPVQKSLPVDGKRMTEEEYAAYNDVISSMRRKILTVLTGNEAFQNASDEQKASTVEYINKMINSAASEKVKDMRGTKPSNEAYTGNEYIGKGNIDLHNLKPIADDEGNWMTTYSYTIQDKDGKWVNIPGIVDLDGKRQMVDEETATQMYYDAGEDAKYFGKFDTLAQAVAAADALHLEQETYYDLPQSELAGLIDIAGKTDDFANYALLHTATMFTGSDNYEPDFEFLESLMKSFESYDPLVQNAIKKDGKFKAIYEAWENEIPVDKFWNLDSAYRAATSKDTPENLDALSAYILNSDYTGVLDYYERKKGAAFEKMREAAEIGKKKGFGLAQYDHVRDAVTAMFNDDATEDEIQRYDKIRNAANDSLIDLIAEQYSDQYAFKKLAAANKAGYSTEEFFKVYDAYRDIKKDETLTANQQHDQFATWLRKEFDDESDVQFFRDMLKITAVRTVKDTTKDKFFDYGFTDKSAQYVSDLLDDLQPQEGHKGIRDCQYVVALDDAYRNGNLSDLGWTDDEWKNFMYLYMEKTMNSDKFRTNYPTYEAAIRHYRNQYANP